MTKRLSVILLLAFSASCSSSCDEEKFFRDQVDLLLELAFLDIKLLDRMMDSADNNIPTLVGNIGVRVKTIREINDAYGPYTYASEQIDRMCSMILSLSRASGEANGRLAPIAEIPIDYLRGFAEGSGGSCP